MSGAVEFSEAGAQFALQAVSNIVIPTELPIGLVAPAPDPADDIPAGESTPS